MRIILLRHGPDLRSDCGESTLSWQGREKVAQTARQLQELSLTKIDVAFFSSARRAAETLEVVAGYLNIDRSIPTPRLLPSASPLEIDTLLNSSLVTKEDRVCLIVGHEPQISDRVLRWCGLPDNSERDPSVSPWTLSRGECLILSASRSNGELQIDRRYIQFVGRNRSLPIQQQLKKAGVF